MIVVPRLAALLWRRGGAGQRATLALTAAGVCFSVALALLALSVGPALSARGERVAWHTATPVPVARATALQGTVSDRFGDRSITRVDLAPTGAGRAPTPPGLRAFPRPGEVWVSPAMADLLASRPRAELADRYPATVAGEIGPAGLAHADELAVVVGRAPGALTPTPGRGVVSGPPFEGGTVVPIDGFAHHGMDQVLRLYRVLALIAAVLLAVPTFLLVGAAARLAASQREQRLAVLRLAGATPGAVVGLTALEILGAALVGTVAGIVAYLGVLPVAAAHLPLAGGRFPVGELRLGAAWLAGSLLVVPAIAVVSAIAGLRAVVIGPLGVSRRTRPPRPRVWRLLVLPVAWAGFLLSVASMSDGGSPVPALIGLGAVIATLSMAGVWLTWALGSLLTLLARRPAPLLAGRRITADAKGAYRTVSGVVLAGLIAGFLFAVIPTIEGGEAGPVADGEVLVEVAAARAPAVRAALRRADPKARVELRRAEEEPHVMTEPSEVGTVRGSTPGKVERIRTAVLAADPDAILTVTDDRPHLLQLLEDLRRASVVMALASLAMATASLAVSGSAAVLEQRVTLTRLRLIGTPVSVLQRARRWQMLLPLVCASVGAMVSGVVAGLAMMRAAGAPPSRIAPPAWGELALLAGAAVVAGVAVVAATRPLLVATSRTTPS